MKDERKYDFSEAEEFTGITALFHLGLFPLPPVDI